MSTQVTLTLPDTIVRQAEQIAHTTERSVEAVLTETLERAFPHQLAGPPIDNPADEKLASEIEAWEHQFSSLRAQYRGQYVAMHEGQVVDVDAGLEPLFLRVQKRYGDQPVLIRRVDETPDEVYRARGPRLEPKQ